MRSRLKEECLDEAFQEIQARGCSNNKPESNTFRITVEKQAGTRGDTKINKLYMVGIPRWLLWSPWGLICSPALPQLRGPSFSWCAGSSTAHTSGLTPTNASLTPLRCLASARVRLTVCSLRSTPGTHSLPCPDPCASHQSWRSSPTSSTSTAWVPAPTSSTKAVPPPIFAPRAPLWSRVDRRHLFFGCHLAADVWSCLDVPVPVWRFSIWDLRPPLPVPDATWHMGVATILWSIWKSRNNLVLNGRSSTSRSAAEGPPPCTLAAAPPDCHPGGVGCVTVLHSG
jgi:hypothetical protein